MPNIRDQAEAYLPQPQEDFPQTMREKLKQLKTFSYS